MKARRVPPTRSRRFRIAVATGGNPAAALSRAASQLVRPGVWSVGISHDDGCPALEGLGLTACTCEIVGLEGRRVA